MRASWLQTSLGIASAAVVVGLAAFGAYTFVTFSPLAITVGPNTTLYFRDDPPLTTRVHEAVHRRQMREKTPIARVLSALRYNFDYDYRLDEEAEAKAAELCLQIHRFTPELYLYTTARSRSQAEAYRAWGWERVGVTVPDRVGYRLQHGEACQAILAGVELDLDEGAVLSAEDERRLAAFHFLRSYGSGERDVARWKARLRLAAYAEPARWSFPEDVPRFGLLALGRTMMFPVDSAIAPEAAGRALHRLTYYGAERVSVQVQPPLPGYRARPLLEPGDGEDRVGIPLEAWPEELVARALEGRLGEEAQAWLDVLAAHPLHEDFRLFALAPAADVVGTRYRLDAAGAHGSLAWSDLGALREAFRSQWGLAAGALAAGDTVGAEAVLRRTAAGAIRLVESAPFPVDVLEGLDFLQLALEDLGRLRRARTGEDPVWLDEVRRPDPVRWVRGPRLALFSEDPAVLYHALPRLAGDEGIPHAFRRFAYEQVVLYDVCLADRADGVPPAHAGWRRALEAGLVRRPSDAALLEVMRSGVREALREGGVVPEAICDPDMVVHPHGRMAILSAPLRHTTIRAADQD